MRSVEYTREAARDVRRLRGKARDRILEAVRELANDPLAGKKLRGRFEALGLRSFRSWPFRIIYRYDDARVVVETVAHRRDVYR